MPLGHECVVRHLGTDQLFTSYINKSTVHFILYVERGTYSYEIKIELICGFPQQNDVLRQNDSHIHIAL